MTNPEKLVWAAVYAARWIELRNNGDPSIQTHEHRARAAALQANYAVDALRNLVSCGERGWSTDVAKAFLNEQTNFSNHE